MSGKKPVKSTLLKRLNAWIHLWLGLASGIIVFIVSITGCIYVFEAEIREFVEDWRAVEDRVGVPFIAPSILLDTAESYIDGVPASGLTYSHRFGAAAVGFTERVDGKMSFKVVFLNPYDGHYLGQQTTIGGDHFDFFRFIIDGHRALWLPYDIGRPIVGVATLIFVSLLVTGLVLWWPKRWTQATRDASFKVRWKAKWKRLNYDLHNVLGFYSLVLALILALTGLVWSFSWFDRGVYYLASGGESKPEHHHPHSVVLTERLDSLSHKERLDIAFQQVMDKGMPVQGIYLTPYLADEDDPIDITVYHQKGKWYDHSEYFFDRYTLAELEHPGSAYRGANLAEKVSMLNYDIHIGSVGGILGKIIAFLASLTCASLPITGFFVWWNKKKKSKRQKT